MAYILVELQGCATHSTMASFSFALPKSNMDKSKICLSFFLLFSSLLSSSVFAYDELPETSLDIGFPAPPDVLSFPIQDVVGNSAVSKDIAEADKLGLENSKLDWEIVIGSGGRRRSNGRGNPAIGGIGGIGGIDNGGFDNGGWGGDFMSTEPMNHKDASIMRHQNMKKFSEFDHRSSSESKAAKKFVMKKFGSTYYHCVPRIEDIGDDKKN